MALNPARIGVFGGAFDPPHNAHVALAEAALAQLDLAQLRIFPTGQAWHKAGVLSSPEDRLAMAQLAFGPLARVAVDARELLRPGPTYTLDTLRELLHEQLDIQPVLIMGADQAADLPTWHGWREILSIAIISIADRAHSTGSEGRFDPQTLSDLPSNARFEALTLAPMNVSSTELRRRVARGEDISHLVSPAVARYIAQHNLYQSA